LRLDIRYSASAAPAEIPGASDRRAVVEGDCFNPFSYPSDQPLAPNHSICDIGDKIPLRKCRLLAHRTERAVVSEEAVDTIRMEDVATREFADNCLVVLEIVQTD